MCHISPSNGDSLRTPAATRPAAFRVGFAFLCILGLASVSTSQATSVLPSSPDWFAADGTATTNFASDVNTAGDVNGDGFSDVIISCPGLNADNGAAFVYYGSSSGLLSSPSWVAHGTQSGLQYSNESFGAGDVNGDGFDDIIVGARGYNYIGPRQTLEGAAFVYYGSATGPSATPDWEIHGEIEDMQLGRIVSSAGDVNGDGYDDVLVGAYVGTGTLRVYFGSASGLSPEAWDWSVAGYGTVASSAGDVNGDGYDDVLVGSSGVNRAYVFFGSSSGPSLTPDWIGVGGSGTYFGGSVAPAGDVDGDGYADIIIGARLYGSLDTGRVWVYRGGPTGPDTSINFAPTLPDGAEFGYDVQTAGDVNADGFADVLVGAQFYDGANPKEGRAYLFLGGASGVVAAADWAFGGPGPNDYMGRGVSGAGDVNADGYSDVILGAPSATFDDTNEGIAYAFYGRRSGLNYLAAQIRTIADESAHLGQSVAYAGDLNGDGLGDIVAGAYAYDGNWVDEGTFLVWHGATTKDGHIEYVAQRYGSEPGEFFGISTGRAGDVNGDGYDDLIAGAPLHDGTFTDGGAAYIYFGSESGIPTTPQWTTLGEAETAWYGYSTSGAGDVNGDGFADVLVGSVAYTNTLTWQGKAYLYFGSETGPSLTPDWSIEGGTENDLLGQNVTAAGDVNGDGFSDIAVSAPNYTGNLDNEGAVFVYLGSPTGPASTPDWTALAGQEGASSSHGATAGDVNGDGYDDFLVAIDFYDTSASQGGRVECYYGSASGLSILPDWSMEGAFIGGWLGRSISTAGDVNRDGYADVIIGEENYDASNLNQGAIYLLLGGPSGLSTYDSIHTGFQENSGYGFSCSTAGDLNGDGFADVIVGANDYDGSHDNSGAIFVYLGNADAVAGGMDIRPRQKTTMGDPITLLGSSDSSSEFVLASRARSAMGRKRVRSEWQIAESGTPLDSQPVEVSPWFDSGSPAADMGSAIDIEEDVFGLSPDSQYHWRVRTRTRSLYAPLTMWTNIAPAGATTAHLRTSGATTEVSSDQTAQPGFGIDAIAPNPLRLGTTVSFRNLQPGIVRMTVHDVAGRRIATVVDGLYTAGPHNIHWKGQDGEGRMVPSGLYLVRLSTPTHTDTRKVWVTR